MQVNTSYKALQMIEAFRSGIPSSLISGTFTLGREDILNHINKIMLRINETGIAESFTFQAEYGNGKTHLLNQIFDLALKKNFVVSKVVLNQETPMSHLYVLYQKAARNCFLPNYHLPGFSYPLSRLSNRDAKVEDLLIHADSYFPRLKLVLEICLKGINEENQHLSYGDLLGSFLDSKNIRDAYRYEFKKAIKVPKLRKSNTLEMLDYFRFLTLLFKAMGYSGWIILFDEAELIERHGARSRIKAYLNLHHLMNLSGSLEVPLLSIYAFASTFETFLHEKNDLEKLPNKTKELMDEKHAKMVEETIKYLLNTQTLSDISQSDLKKIIQDVKQLHGEAFQWNPPDLNFSEGTVEHRVRTMVRKVVQSLDLAYLGRSTELMVDAIEEKPLEEDENFFRTFEEEKEDTIL